MESAQNRKTMKEVRITGVGELEYVDVELPQLEDNEVLVEVALTGICGSDIPRYLQGQVHVFPQVLGHEFSGTVVAVGKKVDAELIDKRVAGIPLVPCMMCDSCQGGNFALCKSYSFIGSRRQGSMAQYVAVPHTNVLEVGEEVSMLQAAFFEPATVALHGAQLLDISRKSCPQGSIAVIGAGTIGILLAQALVAFGADVVVLFDTAKERLEVAGAAGLTHLIDVTDAEREKKVHDIVGDAGFTHVFDVAGASESIAYSFKIAGSHGQICLIGNPRSPVTMTAQQWEEINRKELSIVGSWMSYSAPWPGVEWHDAVSLFADGSLRIVDEMIDATYPLASAKEAFERFRDPSSIKGKILIDSRAPKG